jgi:FkbM family methyltransferase
MNSSQYNSNLHYSFKNNVLLSISRKRWAKRLLQKALPQKIYCDLWKNFRIFFDPRDYQGPSFHLAFDLEKGFENYERENKKSLLPFLNDKDSVFLDIGANIGLYTFWLKRQRPDLKILAYEPEPNAYQCLKKTIEANALNNIFLFNQAVAKEVGEASLFRSNLNAGGHSLSQNSEDKSIHNAIKIKLGPIQLKHLKQLNIEKVNVIKIDVEGAEESAIDGLEEIIKNFRPVILCECSTLQIAQGIGPLKKINDDFQVSYSYKIPRMNISLKYEELSSLAQSLLSQGRQLDDYLLIPN